MMPPLWKRSVSSPTKLELVQMLMGTMQAPAQNMVYVLNGIATKLVRTLDAVREKKSQEE
jgi:large subunit ribosomal protein L10